MEIDNFRNRFLCRSCKKNLISKESLDNHIINCYETRIEKIKEKYNEQIELINKKYNENYDILEEKFIKHIDYIENKYTELLNYLYNQLIKMYMLNQS